MDEATFKERMAAIDAKVTPEDGQKQVDQMHQGWCEMEGNAHGELCKGWEEYKHKREL